MNKKFYMKKKPLSKNVKTLQTMISPPLFSIPPSTLTPPFKNEIFHSPL